MNEEKQRRKMRRAACKRKPPFDKQKRIKQTNKEHKDGNKPPQGSRDEIP